jgi:hypothetical protein
MLITQRILAISAVVSLASLCPGAANAGFPFNTDDPGTQGAGKIELDLFVQYSRFATGSSGSMPGVSFAYGVTDNFDLTLGVPLAMAQVNGVGTNMGIGDASTGFKWRLVDEQTDAWVPSVAITPTVFWPSGSQVRGTGLGYIRGYIPVWFGKTFGDWSVFTGGGININQGTIAGVSQRNWWFAGLGATYQIDDSWSAGAEVYYTSPIATNAKNLVGFNVAVIYALAPGHSIMAMGGRNVVNAMNTNQFSGLIAYQLKY